MQMIACLNDCLEKPGQVGAPEMMKMDVVAGRGWETARSNFSSAVLQQPHLALCVREPAGVPTLSLCGGEGVAILIVAMTWILQCSDWPAIFLPMVAALTRKQTLTDRAGLLVSDLS